MRRKTYALPKPRTDVVPIINVSLVVVLTLMVMPVAVLLLSALAASLPGPAAAISNPGPHGFSQLLYAYTSAGANNGSAFAGFGANTAFHNLMLGLGMLIGRFGYILPVLALAGEEQIAGVLMARPEWDADRSVAWIGVLRPWRRRGIGSALLRQALGEFHRRGIYKVGLGVDGDSLTGATQLYERAGMQVFQQRDAYEKVLRPGKDLTAREL